MLENGAVGPVRASLLPLFFVFHESEYFGLFGHNFELKAIYSGRKITRFLASEFTTEIWRNVDENGGVGPVRASLLPLFFVWAENAFWSFIDYRN